FLKYKMYKFLQEYNSFRQDISIDKKIHDLEEYKKDYGIHYLDEIFLNNETHKLKIYFQVTNKGILHVGEVNASQITSFSVKISNLRVYNIVRFLFQLYKDPKFN